MRTLIVLATVLLMLLPVSAFAIESKTVKAVQGKDSDYFDYEEPKGT